MMKKVFLITAALILAISCSGSPTDPTGDGGLIDEGSGTTDPNQISAFLNKYPGRYYVEDADGAIYINYRIEGSKIYEGESTTEMQGSKTLSGNKLQVEIPGNTSSQYGSDWNTSMEILNFSDSGIQVFQKLILSKDNFSTISGYQKVTTISGLKKYAGNYYQYQGYNDGTGSSTVEKYSIFTIDSSGNIYITNNMASQTRCSLDGDVLTLDFTDGVYKCILQENRAIASTFINNVEYSTTSKKSDLLTPYKGTYTGEAVTLTVDEADAVITSGNLMNPTAILNGKDLIIYDSWRENDVPKKEEHKIVFNDDGTATYTKPDSTEVTLTKN
ncbi:hypothetical protein [Brachyspira sp. SAP_772]|uniref:hypothetical protein n=1 Tax=Brachyspira sp. SAP_772 TaxID=2608385 RepID=UPI0012F51526|nr:hypothetical protein [Brachyspira sp. SAP_772]